MQFTEMQQLELVRWHWISFRGLCHMSYHQMNLSLNYINKLASAPCRAASGHGGLVNRRPSAGDSQTFIRCSRILADCIAPPFQHFYAVEIPRTIGAHFNTVRYGKNKNFEIPFFPWHSAYIKSIWLKISWSFYFKLLRLSRKTEKMENPKMGQN